MTTARKRQREASVGPRGDTPPVNPPTKGSSASAASAGTTAAAPSDTLESVPPCTNPKAGSDGGGGNGDGKDKAVLDDSVVRDGSGEADKLPPEQRVTVCCPIVFGSCAFYLGTKLADQSHTHRWTLYVRGAHGEDLSYMLEKAVFTLHHSFASPVREVTQWPFEVTECGWGEFKAKISLHFKDKDQQPVEALHVIKLHWPDHETSGSQNLESRKAPDGSLLPIVNEQYDEVVFTNPSQSFFECLMEGQKAQPREHYLQKHYTNKSDVEDLQILTAARCYIQEELQEARDRILRLDARNNTAALPQPNE